MTILILAAILIVVFIVIRHYEFYRNVAIQKTNIASKELLLKMTIDEFANVNSAAHYKDIEKRRDKLIEEISKLKEKLAETISTKKIPKEICNDNHIGFD